MQIQPLGKLTIYGFQILFAASIAIGSQSVSLQNIEQWLGIVARYVIYLYLIRGSRFAISSAYQLLQSRSSADLTRQFRDYQKHVYFFCVAVVTVLYRKQRIFGEDFLFLFIAYLITEYPDMERHGRNVTYGTGMACSYFEGYLTHVIPSDGHRFVGFEENIIAFEGSQSIRFPVKRLFIVITKTMYCPPDLKLLDSRLEACKSLEKVEKDVAGVKNRSYRNSAYKINRTGSQPVYLAVECATPIHTLYLVLKNRTLYQELNGIDETEVVSDFMSMLANIISKSPECRDKCEIIYFDNTDPSQRLSALLLERIRQIEPNFEEVILRNDRE